MNVFEAIDAATFAVGSVIYGRTVTADTGEVFLANIEDVPPPVDPDRPAQGKVPIYATITGPVDCVDDPRAVKTLAEADGRFYTVLRYDETRGDMVTWKWFCEAQRL